MGPRGVQRAPGGVCLNHKSNNDKENIMTLQIAIQIIENKFLAGIITRECADRNIETVKRWYGMAV